MTAQNNFDQFLQQAWKDHGNEPQIVASRLPEGISLLKKPEQVAPLARLIVHVMGEHLGQIQNGIQLLEQLSQSAVAPKSVTETQRVLKRSIAMLQMQSEAKISLQEFLPADQVNILCVVTSALSSKNNYVAAAETFSNAVNVANQGLEKADPANRALAVAGNNLACALEEKSDRTPPQTQLMILAAQTGRKYWEIAGGWQDTQFGEYRLVKTFLQAKDATAALAHAKKCVELGIKNQGTEMDMIYAYEVLALAEKFSQNLNGFETAKKMALQCFEKMNTEQKEQCQGIIQALS